MSHRIQRGCEGRTSLPAHGDEGADPLALGHAGANQSRVAYLEVYSQNACCSRPRVGLHSPRPSQGSAISPSPPHKVIPTQGSTGAAAVLPSSPGCKKVGLENKKGRKKTSRDWDCWRWQREGASHEGKGRNKPSTHQGCYEQERHADKLKQTVRTPDIFKSPFSLAAFFLLLCMLKIHLQKQLQCPQREKYPSRRQTSL